MKKLLLTTLFLGLTATLFSQQSVVDIAYGLVGKKIKSGLCYEFVVKVMAEAKDEKYGAMKGKYRRYLIPVDSGAVKPGYIAWFKGYEGSEGLKASDHIAVVSRVTPERIFILHQNLDGSRVTETALDPSIKKGKIEYYRILGVDK